MSLVLGLGGGGCVFSDISDWVDLFLEGDMIKEHREPPPGDNSYSNMLQRCQVSPMDENRSDT